MPTDSPKRDLSKPTLDPIQNRFGTETASYHTEVDWHQNRSNVGNATYFCNGQHHVKRFSNLWSLQSCHLLLFSHLKLSATNKRHLSNARSFLGKQPGCQSQKTVWGVLLRFYFSNISGLHITGRIHPATVLGRASNITIPDPKLEMK